MSTSAYPFKTYGPQNYGLGFFSPEDCTDAGINCTYNRFPNFDFLKEAYESYDNSSEPTLSNYKVPANHVETSTCPKKSPILSEFTWEGDSTKSLACPAKAESRYQCPNMPAPKLPEASAGSLFGSQGSLVQSLDGSGGSLQLDQINSANSGSGNSTSPPTIAGAGSRYEGVAVSLLVSALATALLSY
ncbi:Glycoside hydrolase [Phytophthora megakarya]|uniref:Glycoside hydrolase n=1 Tax=Phytophthora megakarya TaxID=4795 RepID=A0A225WT73_9STRA|nr:Glycoside hydrolase [Phytophthora megakarya]